MTIRCRAQGVFLLAFSAFTALADEMPVSDISFDHVDRVVITTGAIKRRFLNDYHYAILKLALEHSEDQFGPFSLDYYDADINNTRVLREMETTSGEGKINVHITTSSLLRQTRLTTIHIPVRMGLLGYRLVVVHKKNLAKFSNIRTMEELRQYRVGSGARWTTTPILEKHGFQVVPFPRIEPMYSMLERERFDFVLRGVSEIYQEWDGCKEDCDNLAVVPGVQVYLPLPYYVFVSRHHPRIAERIEKGLLAATNDGSFKALFLSHHGGFLKRAKVAAREIINIPNHDLFDDPALKEPAFWLTPSDISEAETAPSGADFDDIMPGP